MRRLVGLLLVLGLFVATHALTARQPAPPTLILVSIDGWRWDYQQRVPVPNLQRLAARGVRADALIPSFPSKTFPNHYTIVTGLYPAHHGIIANTIRDAATGRMFSLGNLREVYDPMWWGGEPLWVTAERAGRRVAPYGWPGSATPIMGRTPNPLEAYDRSVTGSERVRTILQRLDAPVDERPTLLTLYFEDVDDAGHADGPDSEAVRDAAMRVDAYIGRLIDGLVQRQLLETTNIVVVSDHGMAATTSDRVVLVEDYISLDDVDISEINPTLGIFPKEGKLDAVYRALRNAHPRLKVYRREQTPAHWHYRDHARIPPIVGVADEGWQVMRRASLRDILTRLVRGDGGQHGYDPQTAPSMRGIFIAAGPSFKTGAQVRAFENVHVYNVLARAQRLMPATNDGDPAVARQLLR